MHIDSNGLRLEVEVHGPADGEPLVLIMGLGMQLVAWELGFVDLLVDRGFRVVRFDNRDTGLSSGFDAAGVPNLAGAWLRHRLGLPIAAPYTLRDMADDTAGLMDALGIPSAHVCGASMGGMIAQHLAVAHPAKVRSLTLVMTSGGARRLPGPAWRVRRTAIARPRDPRDVEAIVAHAMRMHRVIGSPAHPPEADFLRTRWERAVRRAWRPDGALRHLVAIAADGDRSALLARIRQPVQIIHGLDDPMVPIEAGRDLARRLPEAEVDFVPGMGHDLPPPLWPRFVDRIAAVSARAGGRSGRPDA